MSEIAREELHYPIVVAEFFLALHGRGLLLSPLDEELIAEWEKRGLPVPVVCRGIRRGIEVFREEVPVRTVRSLRTLRGFVEEEWRAYRSGQVGEAPAPPDEATAAAERLKRARAQLLESARGETPQRELAYRAAGRALETVEGFAGSPLERVASALAAADHLLVKTWLSALPRAERTALGARARLLAGARPRGTSPRAHRETLRAHLLDLARRAGMNPLCGSV